MTFTESVRSFQVPEAPWTSAWPPSRPSVPTSRATRVTSSAKDRQLVDHGVHDPADALELTLDRVAVHVEGHLLGEVALGHGRDDTGHLVGGPHQVVDQAVDRAGRRGPQPAGAVELHPLGEPALTAGGPGHPGHLLAELGLAGGEGVEPLGHLGIGTGAAGGQPDAVLAGLRRGERLGTAPPGTCPWRRCRCLRRGRPRSSPTPYGSVDRHAFTPPAMAANQVPERGRRPVVVDHPQGTEALAVARSPTVASGFAGRGAQLPRRGSSASECDYR